TLLASHRRSSRPRASIALSLVVHAGFGVGIVVATEATDVIPGIREVAVDPVFLPPPREPARHAVTGTLGSSVAGLPAAPSLPVSVAAPMVVPLDSIDLDRLSAPIRASQLVAGSAPCSQSCSPAIGELTTATFGESQVDEPATIISQPRLRYPAALEAA